jgi:hypothetical protein
MLRRLVGAEMCITHSKYTGAAAAGGAAPLAYIRLAVYSLERI